MNILQYLLEKYPNKRWDWLSISDNTNITMKIIEKYPDKPWEWGMWGISQNPNLTMEFIEKYPNKPWKWGYIPMNPNITMEFIEKNTDKIYFRWLSSNSFTLENKRLKKKEAYWLLEGTRAFNRIENLVISSTYM